MTVNEFFKQARAKGKWYVTKRHGNVRCRGLCPLAAVTGPSALNPLGQWGPSLAEEELQLPTGWGWRIANAADDKSNRYRPRLLKRLGIRAA